MVAPALADALATLEAGQDELASLFDQLTEAEFIRPGTMGSSGWAAKDLVGHVAFWEEWHAPASRENPAEPNLGEMLGGVLGAPNQPFGHAYAHLGDLRDYVRSLGKPNRPLAG